jgi:multidrug resistance efflux pump
MEIEAREARVQADLEIREDKLERREHELSTLEDKLGQKESELAQYVAQVQGELKRREEGWWDKVTGGDAPAED